MEEAADRYGLIMSDCKEQAANGNLDEAIDLALEATEFVVGMMRYEKRYGETSEFRSVSCYEFILRHAPSMMRLDAIECLEDQLGSKSWLEKNTEANLSEQVSVAREEVVMAARVWGHVRSDGETRQRRLATELGGDQGRHRSLVEKWDQLGVVKRVGESQSYRVVLDDHLDRTSLARCSACGAKVRGPMRSFLEFLSCPRCSQEVAFVILEVDSDSDSSTDGGAE